jgi:CubicO group peptidase (beta-lactamase class C family)
MMMRFALAILCGLGASMAALAQVYPGADWETRKPSEMGFEEQAMRKLLPKIGIGGVIIRRGYLVASWGNPEIAVQTASMGKSFTSTVLGLAVDAGLVKLDDPVWKTWTGEDMLSHPHKYLNRGHHSGVTWRHLANMTSGFQDIDLFSSQAGEMGDLTWNYAKRPPGKEYEYSDGAMWRFSQLLTKLWGKDIKAVMDEKIFSHIGVSPQRWDWIPGRYILENTLYPTWPGYGRYLDLRWEIGGNVVRAGPGWVVICAKDAARFGYLFLRKGRWREKQLISESWISQLQRAQSRAHRDEGGTGYSLNWWLPQEGRVFEARGLNIDWKAVSRISVVPDLELVVAAIRTNYNARSQQEAEEIGAGDRDWLFRLMETMER